MDEYKDPTTFVEKFVEQLSQRNLDEDTVTHDNRVQTRITEHFLDCQTSSTLVLFRIQFEIHWKMIPVFVSFCEIHTGDGLGVHH